MKTSEILIKARELLSDPTRWARGYYAFDEKGNSKEAQSSDAVCFCSLGAVALVSGQKTGVGYSKNSRAADYLKTAIAESGSSLSIVNYNDKCSHAEVIGMFDRAITLAQEKGE